MTEAKKVSLGPVTLGEGEMRGFPVGRRNVLVACVGGRLKAIDDWCNHAGCLLSGGHLEENMVVCPCHEIGFDLDTGKNMTSPGIADDQPAFTAELRDGELVLLDFPGE